MATNKSTFATEGVKSRKILAGTSDEPKKIGRPKVKTAPTATLRLYIEQDEMDILKEKAGDVPLARYVRLFLRRNGLFDQE